MNQEYIKTMAIALPEDVRVVYVAAEICCTLFGQSADARFRACLLNGTVAV